MTSPRSRTGLAFLSLALAGAFVTAYTGVGSWFTAQTGGGDPRAGCYWNNPEMQDFSNDGRTMVFDAMSENIVSGSDDLGPQLYIFDTVTRETLKLTDERNVSGMPLDGRDPKISGNGKYIAFVGLPTPDDNASHRMMLMNLETHAVTEISSGFVFYGPSDISDDGRYVLYRGNCLNLYDREKDSTVLISGFARDVSGKFISGYCTKTAKNPTKTDPLLTDRHVSRAFITPDGKTVFFSAFDPEMRTNALYRYNVDGTSAPWQIGSLNGGVIVMNRDRTLMYFENITPDSRRSVNRQPTNMSTRPELVNPGNNAVNDGGLFLFSTSGDGRKISLVGGQGQHLLVFDGSSTIDLGLHTMPTLYAPLSPDGRWISFTDKGQGQGTFTFRKSLISKSSLTVYDLENRKSIFVAKPGMTCLSSSVSSSASSSSASSSSASSASASSCPAVCGDYIIMEPEECDDAASNSDTQPNACRRNCTKAHCGDNVIDSGEKCDDGNAKNGDGCAANCSIEAASSSSSSSSKSSSSLSSSKSSSSKSGSSSSSALCGNGRRDGAEKCDDGNVKDGDGCSKTCTVEDGWECRLSGGSSSSKKSSASSTTSSQSSAKSSSSVTIDRAVVCCDPAVPRCEEQFGTACTQGKISFEQDMAACKAQCGKSSSSKSSSRQSSSASSAAGAVCPGGMICSALQGQGGCMMLQIQSSCVAAGQSCGAGACTGSCYTCPDSSSSAASSTSDATCNAGATCDAYVDDGRCRVQKIPCVQGGSSQATGQNCVKDGCPGACFSCPSTACNDSDGGLNVYVVGTRTVGPQTGIDTCEDARFIKEFYCSSPPPAPVVLVCPNGGTCSNGRCSGGAGWNGDLTCFDTDGGSSTAERGIASLWNLAGTRLQLVTESCVDGNTVREAVCAADGSALNIINLDCPQGQRCDDGRCL